MKKDSKWYLFKYILVYKIKIFVKFMKLYKQLNKRSIIQNFPFFVELIYIVKKDFMNF